MVVIKLQGGLGNQLFQYAFGKAAARRLNTVFRLETSFYEQPRAASVANREYALPMFQVPNLAANGGELKIVCGVFAPWYVTQNRTATRLRKALSQRVGLPNYVAEPHFEYADLVLQDGCFYEGYWQSPRYFATIADDLRADLQFKTQRSTRAEALLRQIQNGNSVCLHVRRGDYLQFSNYEILPLTYYKRAIAHLKSQMPDATIFVFSDDIAWCLQNLNTDISMVFVENFVNLRDEFELMCRCNHYIIANSTLSWWAAWLGTCPNKMVVAPKRWFANGQHTNDLMPAEWLQMEC